ncbi:hypothetical protein [Dehalogenimonas alkenigignens]|nr:hypothetical protein [Dehalogenimonas alkenigignens]
MDKRMPIKGAGKFEEICRNLSLIVAVCGPKLTVGDLQRRGR